MKAKTFVSIIVPAYNNESTIQRCIKSIYQNETPIECIVVVNNSTDHTKQILNRIKDDYPFLQIILSDAKGVSEARNVGLEHANGDIIGFCDADDFYADHAVDAVVAKFHQYSADMIITGLYRTIIENGKMKRTGPQSTLHDRIISVKKAQGLVLNHPDVMGSVCNKFYKAKIIRSINFNHTLTHCEDTHFNMQILKNQHLTILWSDLISYHYVLNPASTTTDNDRCYNSENKLKYLIAIEKIRDEYKGNMHVKIETSYKIATLCIENYHGDLSAERKRSLRKSLFSNYAYILINFFKYGMIRNVKMIIKGLCIFFY